MGSNYDFRSIPSRVVNYFESKFKSKSSQVKNLKKLEEVVDGKNQFSQAVQKCKVQCKRLLGENFKINNKDFDEINRTQEHLFGDKGSYSGIQFKAFQEHLKSKGREYDPLKKELNSYIASDKIYKNDRPAPKGGSQLENAIAQLDKAISDKLRVFSNDPIRKYIGFLSAQERTQAMKAGVKNLPVGESIILDAQTSNPVGTDKVLKPGHAMLMRLTHNQDGTFKMEFVNTGGGISNSKFHPKSESEPHKCQTVACIDGISRKQLLENHFFETFCSIASGEDIPPESCLDADLRNKANDLLKPKDDQIQSVMTRIEALYLCLSTLGEPVKMPENSNYYSRPQIGGSCSVSPLWVISKIILPEKSITELEKDTKLKSLLRNYKLIENGYDQSSTRKIMVLDQVESLKHIYEGDAKALKVLNKIEGKLKGDMGIDRVESKIKNGRIRLENFLSKSDSPNEFSIASMQGKLTRRKGTLKLDVKWEIPESAVNYDVTRSDHGLSGKDRADSMFLLYFAIANGDQKSCEKYIQEVLSKPKVYSEKYQEVERLLGSLSDDLSDSNTRSDIAKKYFLIRLMERNNPDLKSKYDGMAVEAHLTDDNIWVKGINELKTQAANKDAEYVAKLIDKAKSGDPEDLFDLGQHYWMRKNFKEAAIHFQKAADQGDKYAQLKMGWIYERDPEAVDKETAIKYFSMAAAQGEEQAQLALNRLQKAQS